MELVIKIPQLFRQFQRFALVAVAGIGGKSHQTPNPPFGAAFPQVWANAHTCPVHAVLGGTSRLFGSWILVFHFPGMIERVKGGVPYQVPQRPLAGQFTL